MSVHDDELRPDEDSDVSLAQLSSGEAQPPSNVLESLRRTRKEIEETRETDLPVPGYDREPPHLYIRYGLVDGHQLAKMARKVSKQTKDAWDRQLYTAIDSMIEACIGFFIDFDDGSGRHELTLRGDHITTFGPELAEALGIPPDSAQSARAVVRELFGNNDVALANHNIRLSRWMSNTTSEVDEELLGGNP